MTCHPPNLVTFAVTEVIFGVDRLASRLKSLESINQIGPWHVGHWTVYTHRHPIEFDAESALAFGH